MVRHNDRDRRDGGHAMRRVSRRAYADRPLPHWAVLVLGGGVVAMVLLVVTVTDGRAGGLFDWLFTGKEAQRSDASPSQQNAPLTTVRLRVEGMVCYG